MLVCRHSESHDSPASANRESDALWVEVSRTHSEVVLHVHGEADLATCEVLGQSLVAVADDDPAQVVLECTDLQFIDAHCLGVVANAHCRLREHHRSLVLRSPSRLLRHMLKLCEMESLVEA